MEAYRYLAKVYDDMMHDVDYTSWAQYLHKIMQPIGAKKVLDIACGTGGLTFALHHLGYDITATDISAHMLKTAKEKARDIGQSIQFVRQDICSIEVGNKVDAIVCACDGVNYIDIHEVRLFAASAYKALKCGGLLLFDISTAYKLKHEMDGQVFFDDSEDAVCIWQNSFEEKRNALNMDVTIFLRKDRLFERYDEHHIQYAHNPNHILDILNETGFAENKKYEWLTLQPPKNDTYRIQFVCKK